MTETNGKRSAQSAQETGKRKPGRPKIYPERAGMNGDAQKRWRERQIESGKKFVQVWASPETALEIKEMVKKEREKEKNSRKK